MKRTKSTLLLFIIIFFTSIIAPSISIAQTVNGAINHKGSAGNGFSKEITKTSSSIEVFNLVVTPSWGDTLCVTKTDKLALNITNLGNTLIDSLVLKFEIPGSNIVLFTGVYSDTIQPADTVLFEFVPLSMPLGYNDYSLSCVYPVSADTSRIDTTFLVMVCTYRGSSNDNLNKFKQITLYPNPASSSISVDIEGFTIKKEGLISVYNCFGQLVESVGVLGGDKLVSFNTENYSKGVYYVKLQTNGSIIAVGKFIKE